MSESRFNDIGSAYSRDVGSIALIKGEAETALATEIVQLEFELWSLILSDAEAAKRFQSHLIDTLPDGIETPLSKTVSDAMRRGLKRPCDIEALTVTLRDADADRVYLRAAVKLTDSQSVAALHRRLISAKQRFISANLRLVLSIAKRFKKAGVDHQDIVQDGNMGLIRALEKFDPEMGFRFSTYATWWIRHAISRGIADNGRTVRVPVHRQDKMLLLSRCTRKLSSQLGRDPTPAELESASGVDIATQEKLDDFCLDGIVSLNAPISYEVEAIDLLSGEGEGPEDSAAKTDLVRTINGLLEKLPPREADIIRSRFGLSGSPEPLKVIGARYGVSRERIRQLESLVLDKFKTRLLARKLSSSDLV